MTDRLTDAGRAEPNGKITLLSHALTMRGNDVANLIKFGPVV